MTGEHHRYTVYVDSNLRPMEETELYGLGTFDEFESAVTACKRMVDEFLLMEHRPGTRWQELYQGYLQYGKDPYIISSDVRCSFSAWEYAKQRCKELCQNGE